MKLSSAVSLLFLGSSRAFTSSPSLSRLNTALNVVLESTTGRSQLDPDVIDRYGSLPFPKDKILAEYVWVDAVGNTRSKTRTLAAEKVSDDVLLLLVTLSHYCTTHRANPLTLFPSGISMVRPLIKLQETTLKSSSSLAASFGTLSVLVPME